MEASRKQTSDIQSKIIKELEESPDIKNNWWLRFEIDMIRKYYHTKGAQALAKALNRTIGSIHHKAIELGLNHKKECFYRNTNKINKI